MTILELFLVVALGIFIKGENLAFYVHCFNFNFLKFLLNLMLYVLHIDTTRIMIYISKPLPYNFSSISHFSLFLCR